MGEYAKSFLGNGFGKYVPVASQLQHLNNNGSGMFSVWSVLRFYELL
jgi:hypothetical protein